MRPIRLTAVLTHPIQYYAPWFRQIAQEATDLCLTAVHAIEPTPEQQGVGFDRAFTWDVPLTEGYNSVTARSARGSDRIDSTHFWGLDVPEIGDAILKTAPDVVLIGGWYSVTLVRALAACRRAGIPALYRGDSHLLSGPRHWLRRAPWLIKTALLLHQFSGFLSPGRRVNEYLRWYHVAEHRIFDVPHVIDNEFFARGAALYQNPIARVDARRDFGIHPEAFVVLFVGKLVESKRPINVIRAVARLGAGVTVLMVGSGPLEARVKVEASRLGVALRFVGFLNQTELPKAYAVADCLTLPSDFPETWGLVVNEALATGLPVVVSHAVGCAPDLVRDGETGYTYPLDHIEALADRLERVRARKNERHDWGPRCREVISAYSYQAMTQGLIHACRSMLPESLDSKPMWQDAPIRILACCGLMVVPGGLERMTFRALGVMRERRAEVHCIVNGWENYRITPLAEAIGASWSTGPYWHALTRRRLTPIKIAKMIVEILRVSANTWTWARRIRATHIMLPDYQTVLRNAPALVALRLTGAHIVMRLGNAPDRGRFYRTLWRRVVAPLVDRLVCNSDYTARELAAHGIAQDKIVRIYNVAAPRRQRWQPDAERIPGRVIYIGQIIPEKGVDLLVDAVASLRASDYNITLDIVGSISGWEAPRYQGYRDALQKRALEPDLAGAVQFLGWREDVPSLLAQASLHCCPSRPEQREAFGNVVLEAKLSGVPSVVGPSGDLPELVEHRVTGWVCQTSTADAVAEGLRYFLDQPETLRDAGRAARASSDMFNDKHFGDAWAEVFA
jgi:glycosyltransferase involved in cell wall biosynthesis